MVFINTYFPALSNLWKKEQKYKHLASPSGNPPSGSCFFWCKSDNKMYVKDSSGNEEQIGGIGGKASDAWKEPVLNTTTANITLSGEQTLDGILTSVSRILVKDQTTASENGIYVTAAGAWARAEDLSTQSDTLSGAIIHIKEGTINADFTFVLTTNDTITIGTTGLVFAKLISDAEISTAYFAQVALASQAEAEAGTVTNNRRFTPERIKQAIDALAAGTPFGAGDGSDGAVTISADTDLGSANKKRYSSLTVDSTFNLFGDTEMKISITGNLVLNGTIHVNGKGCIGGNKGSTLTAGDGGAGGGSLAVIVGGNITGTGIISANGVNGEKGLDGGAASSGSDGGIVTLNGRAHSTSVVADGIVSTGADNAGGSGGGAGIIGDGGKGGDGNQGGESGSVGGDGGLIEEMSSMFDEVVSGGGAGAGNSSGANVRAGGSGAGGGGYIFLTVYGSTTNITLNANGAVGGDAQRTTSGAGGGGGGGLIRALTREDDTITTSVTGGVGGGLGEVGATGINGKVIQGVA